MSLPENHNLRKVSIALCTYNGDRFLQKQIDSYLSQTLLPSEIVVCDDGSTDDTLQIIRQAMAENPGIQWHLVQNERKLGASRNFEKAIALCSGDFIFLSDQDDVWENRKIEQTLSFFNDNPDCDTSFSNATLIDETDRELPETLLDYSFFKAGIRKNFKKNDLLYWSLLLGNVMTGAAMAFKRSALSGMLPFQLDLGKKLWHDGWIGLSSMAVGSLGFIDQTLIKYRVHAGQQIGVVARNDAFERLIMGREYQRDHLREYFQRYLSAFGVMKKLAEVKSLDLAVQEKITVEYLQQKEQYFKSQSFPERKLRLLKWYLRGNRYVSIRDLVTL